MAANQQHPSFRLARAPSRSGLHWQAPRCSRDPGRSAPSAFLRTSLRDPGYQSPPSMSDLRAISMGLARARSHSLCRCAGD